MATSFKLSIPTPCEANWDRMNPEEKGRHCDQCSQSVYALEEFDNSEVVDLLQQKVCVRIKTNASGQIKTRSGFSSFLLLGGLLACGETSEEQGLTHETEKPVEVLQMTPGESVTVELQETATKEMKPPVMGKIAAPVHSRPENIEMGEVEMVQTEPGTPVQTVEKKSTSASKEDCLEETKEDQQLSN